MKKIDCVKELEGLVVFELVLVSGERPLMGGIASPFAGPAGTHPGEARLLARIRPLLDSYHRLEDPLRVKIRAVLATIAGGQRRDLLRYGYASEDAPQSPSSASDTWSCAYAVAGCAGKFGTRLCALQLLGFPSRTSCGWAAVLGRASSWSTSCGTNPPTSGPAAVTFQRTNCEPSA